VEAGRLGTAQGILTLVPASCSSIGRRLTGWSGASRTGQSASLLRRASSVWTVSSSHVCVPCKAPGEPISAGANHTLPLCE